jgi:hypothetical protein
MRIERTFDVELIKSVLCHPVIWPCIAPDWADASEFEPPIDDDTYYLAAHDPELTGLFIYHPAGDGVMKTHHQVLPEYRGNKSIEYSFASASWIFENTGTQRLICSIPKKYENVIAHAKKGGFSDWKTKGEYCWLKLEREEWAMSKIYQTI